MQYSNDPANPLRRRFFEVSGRYGLTTALIAGSGGFLWNEVAVAQTAADEEAKQMQRRPR